ncbi:MAG: hypothetical protein AB7S69_09285 [Salinivirgaceae bacterium]
MPKYSLNKIVEIEGKQEIYKLEIDDSCQFDDFEREIVKRKQYEEELTSILAHIEDFSNNKTLPEKKFKILNKSDKKDRIKEYEFKSRNLRVYGIKAPDGQIIIMGGYKSNQKKDLKKFRGIKSNYLETKQNEKRKTT